MKNILILFTSLLFIMCKSPQVDYVKYNKDLSDSAVKKFLKDLDAEENNYSVLIFTQQFNGENIKVTNDNKVIYDDSLKTIEGLGLAKQFRINNFLRTVITEKNTGYSFSLKKKDLLKYKYVYIEKDVLKNSRYHINYSNTLRGFR